MVALDLNSNIIEFSFDSGLFNLNLKITFLSLILVLTLIAFCVYTLKSKNKFNLVELEFDASLLKCKFNIQRNYENVE